MTIVLYDNEHFETLEMLVEVFQQGTHQLHLAIPEHMRQTLEDSGILPSDCLHVHVLPAAPALHPRYLKQLCRTQQAALLVLATVSARHLFFARLCRRLSGTRVLLGVHDLRDLFEPKPGGGIKGWLRALGRQHLRHRVAAFFVLLDEMKTLMRTRYEVKQPVLVLPGRCYRVGPAGPAPEGPIRLLVAGSIDESRRNYASVSRLAEMLRQHKAEEKVSISICGGLPQERSLPAGIREPDELVEIRTGAFVPVAAYEAALGHAELIWAPVPERFSRPGHPEENYGSTKSSGSFFDAIRHGKPLLVPDHLPLPTAIQSASLRYPDEAFLLYLLLHLHENRSARERLQELAREQAARFLPQQLYRRLHQQLLRLLADPDSV